MADTNFDDLIPQAPAAPSSFDDLIPKRGNITIKPVSALEKAVEPITSYPETYQAMNREAREQIGHGVNQLSSPSGAWDVAKGLGNVGLGALGYVGSPINAALRTVVGKPIEENAGIPKEYSEFAASLAIPGIGLRPVPRGTVPVPPKPSGPLGVTLSKGQETQELPAIRSEQAAMRGQMGPQAEKIAKEFTEQQSQQLSAAKDNVAQQLDPFGSVVAETPQDAGQIVSQGIKSAAAQRKAGVTAAYDTARSYPGEIHAGAFENIGQKIKGDLTLGDNPIVIDDKLTPFASKAIQDIEDRVSKLKIQNRADPFGAPNSENISGVSLTGVDQMRRRLSAFRKDAFSTGNAADGRAAKAVLDSFDDQIDKAVNGGLFRGDPRAIQAWNDARAAHSDYRSTFTAGKNDPTGRVVERILGKGNNPAAIPNDVADFLYGSTGVNPNSLNVNVANRVKNILGDKSPEWSGVKQGLFSRLIEPPPGMSDWGPQRISQNINRFLNGDGREMSSAIFSAPDRALLQKYADLQRSLVIPKGGVNASETSTFVAPMLKKISGGIAALVGAAIGHAVAPGLYGAGELIGAGIIGKGSSAIKDISSARQIAQQMPLVAAQLKQWQRAVDKANKANAFTPNAANNTALGLASANLARTLQPFGFDPIATLRQLQGTIPSRASDEQQ